MPVEKICIVCGSVFYVPPIRSNQKTCSHNCSKQPGVRNRTKTITKNCPNCGKEFKTYKSIDRKHCSANCANKHTKSITYDKGKRNCLICGKEFLPKHPKSPGLYCSYKCSGLARVKPFIIRSGYRWIYKPDHPCATKQGYYQEHRLIMEHQLGRVLDKKETVHHINHKRDDNRLENLMLMNVSEHSSYHAKLTRSKKIRLEVPYGYCHCGCGQKTRIARSNDKARNKIKGQPLKFLKGHSIF